MNNAKMNELLMLTKAYNDAFQRLNDRDVTKGERSDLMEEIKILSSEISDTENSIIDMCDNNRMLFN